MSLCSQVSCKATLQLQGEPAVGIPPLFNRRASLWSKSKKNRETSPRFVANPLFS